MVVLDVGSFKYTQARSHTGGIALPTQSFYEDMIIDTPEAAKALDDLFDSGKTWKGATDATFTFIDADDPLVVEMMRKYEKEQTGYQDNPGP